MNEKKLTLLQIESAREHAMIHEKYASIYFEALNELSKKDPCYQKLVSLLDIERSCAREGLGNPFIW